MPLPVAWVADAWSNVRCAVANKTWPPGQLPVSSACSARNFVYWPDRGHHSAVLTTRPTNGGPAIAARLSMPSRSRMVPKSGPATPLLRRPGQPLWTRWRRKRSRRWLRHKLTWRVLSPARIRKRRVSVGRCLWLTAGIRICYWWWSGLRLTRWSRGCPMFGRWRLGHQVVLPRARWVRCRADSVIRPAP